MDRHKKLAAQRKRRSYRVRNKVSGTAERPRMCVTRSLTSLSVQLIDDLAGRTLVSGSTQEKSFKESHGYGGNCTAATQLGKIIAQRAKEAGVERVAFDRGSSKYHGRVAALADAAREGGLQF